MNIIESLKPFPRASNKPLPRASNKLNQVINFLFKIWYNESFQSCYLIKTSPSNKFIVYYLTVFYFFIQKEQDILHKNYGIEKFARALIYN